MNKEVAKVISMVKSQVPLVQAITNYVTVNDCANILLAFGASPAMVEAAEESAEFAKISSSIYANIGTLTAEQEVAIISASISAKDNKTPVVLDPVACGAIPRKVNVINKMLELGHISVIKGNAGEIKFLAGEKSETRGVDSTDSGEGIKEAAMRLALKNNCIVVATGKEDIVTDGKRVAIVHNGVEMLTKITGAGCMLGALCAATVATNADRFVSAVSAVVAMGIAGEMAFKESNLPGTFKCKLIDSIYLLSEELIEQEAKIIWE